MTTRRRPTRIGAIDRGTRSHHPIISGTEIIRVQTHLATFVRRSTFCANFRHVRSIARHAIRRAICIHIQDETTPSGIFADDLIAAEMRERAAAKSKLMPSTSQ
jgi:hypothetical protein